MATFNPRFEACAENEAADIKTYMIGMVSDRHDLLLGVLSLAPMLTFSIGYQSIKAQTHCFS